MKKMFLEKGNTALKLLFAAIFLFTSVFTIIPATIAQADGQKNHTGIRRWGRLSSCYGVKFGLQGTTAEVTLNGNTPVWKAGENTSVPLSSIGITI